MTLRSQIIRLAHANTDLRPHLLPLLASTEKEAAKDTADFVTWVLSTQSVLSTRRVLTFLAANGVEQAVSTDTMAGEPIGVGELVEIQADNAPTFLQELLEPYHLRRGEVVKVDGRDIVIQIQAGDLLRVPGGVNAGRASGVYRTSQMEEQGSMKHLEIVYFPENLRPPTKVQKEVLRNYVEKGLSVGEERSPFYFSGYVPNWKIAKDRDPYFMVWTQQRGGRPRVVSPNKGDVFYIGIVGKRPAGWDSKG